MKNVSSIALFLVVSLGLNACGDDKKNKRQQTQIEQVAEVVAPQQNDVSVETETKVDVNQQVEAEKPAEEQKGETPAVEPVQPEAPVVTPQEPVAPVEPSPDPTVACAADAKPYCVAQGKGLYELEYFGRSAPDCQFPEAPKNAVDLSYCGVDSDSKSL